MSVTLTTIETLVRYLLGETSKSQIPGDIFTYRTSGVFTLTENNPIAILEVYVNDDTSGISSSLDTSTNKVTVTDATFLSGDTVEIQYTYYPNYSPTEIQDYIQAALVHLSINKYKDWIVQNSTIYPEPEENEKNLIAIVTGILIEPDNKTYRLPDISIISPSDLPRDEKIRKAIAIAKSNSHGIFTIVE